MKRAFLFLFVSVSFSVFSQRLYMDLHEIVIDSAHIFTPDQLNGLKRKLTRFKMETSHQLVVVTRPSFGSSRRGSSSFSGGGGSSSGDGASGSW